LGRISYGRTLEAVEIPRPDWNDELKKDVEFQELAGKPDKASGGKSSI
jgi:hypothetical protein